MKYFNFDDYKKSIQTNIYTNIIYSLCCTLFAIIIGLACFVLSLIIVSYISDNASLWDAYKDFFSNENEQEESVLARYIVFNYSLLSILAAAIYGGILWLLKLNGFIKELYSTIRESLYELLTLSIFIFGFIPLLLKFSLSEGNDSIINYIDSVTVGFFMGVAPPYIYSIFSKVYSIFNDKKTGIAVQYYLNDRYPTKTK